MEKVQKTLRLPAELEKELTQEAERRGQTTTDVIVFILSAYFAKKATPPE